MKVSSADPAIRAAFDELKDYGHGLLGVDRIQPLFQALDLDLGEDELDALLRPELAPDAAHVTFEQFYGLYVRVVEARGAALHGADARPRSCASRASSYAPALRPGEPASTWRRLCWRVGSRFTISEAAALRGTPLLVAVVVLTLMTAAGVAGLALGLMWQQRSADTYAEVRTQAEMVRRFFGSLEQQQVDARGAFIDQQGSIVSTLVEALGHNLTMQVVGQQLAASALSLALVLENVVVKSALAIHRQSLLTGLVPLAAYINASAAVLGQAAVLAYVDSLNAQALRPYGYGINVARLDASGALTALTSSQSSRRVEANVTLLTPLESTNAGEPLLRGCQGRTGTIVAVDVYGVPVVAAYTHVPSLGVGITLTKSLLSLRTDVLDQMTAALDALNAELPGSLELVLGQWADSVEGDLAYVTGKKLAGGCADTDAGCDGEFPAMRAALLGEHGASLSDDYRPAAVVAGYAPLSMLGMGLVVKLDQDEVVAEIIPYLVAAMNSANLNLFPGSEEVVLCRANFSGNTSQPTLRALTVSKWTGQLTPSDKSVPQYKAAVLHENGLVADVSDYRGKRVISAHRYLPTVDLGIVFKVDLDEINADAAGVLVNVADEFNAGTGYSPEIVLATADAQGRPAFLTALQCADGGCEQRGLALVTQALGVGGAATVQTVDYRGNPVIASYGEVSGLAVIVKSDKSSLTRPLVQLAAKVSGGSAAFILFGVAVTFLTAHRMLGRMRATWRSKLQLEERVKKIEGLMANMYPRTVADRMLRGDPRIVDLVPELTCVMLDIHHFTYLSNQLSAEEMVDLLGYTFGCMDAAAEQYGLYKVKTIGDCYMALAGLPGTASEGPAHALRATHFASGVVQLFSEMFRHPEAGAALLRKATEVKARDRSSFVTGNAHSPNGNGSVNPAGNNATGALPRADEYRSVESHGSSEIATAAGVLAVLPSHGGGGGSSPKRQYSFRVGLASGPGTVGILPGKTPIYDCWGPTINLAARMESTGQAGMIHVSEGAYRLLQRHQASSPEASPPYEFSAPRVTYAKGFGNVRSWLITKTRLPVDEAVVGALSLRFTFREYLFGGGVVPTAPPPALLRGAGGPGGLLDSAGVGQRTSARSHASSMEFTATHVSAWTE